MAGVTASPLHDETSNFEVDKLTYEIFSILENKFLFGYDNPKFSTKESQVSAPTPHNHNKPAATAGKVRILSIDGGGPTDGILSATSLVRLESFIRKKSGNPNAHIADFFDVVAGSGVGGVLAALLFTRQKDRPQSPLFTAEEALKFLIRRKSSMSSGMFRRPEKAARKMLEKAFGDKYTLKDTLKNVLIPCYDMSTHAPFLFSRADAVEMDGYDFKLRDVCAATSAERPFKMRSVDGKTTIVAVDGCLAMNNPTAAAITHVLNNKQEFPLCNGVDDLLVLSLGNGGFEFGASDPCRGYSRIAEDGASEMVDQSVAMAFGQSRDRNYVRIQGGNGIKKKGGMEKKMIAIKHKCPKKSTELVLACTEGILSQRCVEAVLFQGKKIAQITNLEKLEHFAGEVIKEQERRKSSILPNVILKQGGGPCCSSPRTSSATTLSFSSSSS